MTNLSIASLRRDAKRIKRNTGCSYSQALDQVAKVTVFPTSPS